MAFRHSIANAWKSMLTTEGKRPLASSDLGIQNAASSSSSKGGSNGSEYSPIYFVVGFVGVALMIATHTAKQQLMHSQLFNFGKKKGESIQAVVDDTKTLRDPLHPDLFIRPRNAETLKTAALDPARH